MENPEARKSNKITGDKLEPLIDQAMKRGPRRRGKPQRDRGARNEEAELDLESSVERYDDDDFVDR